MNEIATDGYRGILEGLSKECRLRSIPLAGTDADQEKGRSRLVDLCSNDYLGLAARESEFREAFMHSCTDAAFTSSASRLLSSAQRYHLMLEKALEHLYGKRALLFNSGYHANTGCISALAIPSTLFICDKLVHASIIDGLRIGNADFLRFPHNDLGKLRIMLEKNAGKYARIVVVTESIFSMDGDLAPLRGLTMLKEEFPNMILYVDEAHAFGVRGERGMGMAEELGLTDKIDIIIGTFGKAAASSGAFVATTELLADYFINTSRSFIFSTALPPVCCAWTLFMLQNILLMQPERERLLDTSRRLREALGLPCGEEVESQIIPYVTGDAERAVALAARLREEGYLVLPIRRPTVPPGGERLRISLNAGIDYNSLTRLIEIIGNEK